MQMISDETNNTLIKNLENYKDSVATTLKNPSSILEDVLSWILLLLFPFLIGSMLFRGVCIKMLPFSKKRFKK